MKNEDLKNEAELLIAEIEKTHRYSMSRIYSLWNSITSNNEQPQSCASCLIRKVREIKNWLQSQSKAEIAQAEEIPQPKAKRNRTKKKKGQ